MRAALALGRSGASVLNGRYRLRGADRVGSRVRARGPLRVENNGRLFVGNRVQFVSHVAITELVVWAGGEMSIGDRSFINYGVSISAMQHVEIGCDCNIGTHVMVTDNDFHRLEPERRLERPGSRPVIIGDNTWIGGRSIILPGVTIGAGSAVGAGSVVTKDVPARALVVGVPARVVRRL